MMSKHDSSLGLEVFVDGDYVGNWDHQYATNDCDTVQSCHGYIIQDNNCPVIWKS